MYIMYHMYHMYHIAIVLYTIAIMGTINLKTSRACL